MTIKMYFADLDDVSIHTLSCASHQLLFDISKTRKISSVIMDKFKEYTKAEKWDEVATAMNKARNFFKHADRDTDQTLTFNPQQTDIWIWDSCLMYLQLSGEMTDYIHCYHTWFMLHHRDTIKNDAIRLALEDASSLLKRPKQEFLEIALIALQQRIK